MAHSQETRDRVRKLYIEGMPLSSAADACKVSYDTARNWKSKAKSLGDDWDTARAAFRISDAGGDEINRRFVEEFARQFIVTSRELEEADIRPMQKAQLMASLADAYAKFGKAAGRLNPNLSALSVALDTFKIIIEYIKEKDPDAVRALHPHLDEIGGVIGKRYG